MPEAAKVCPFGNSESQRWGAAGKNPGNPAVQAEVLSEDHGYPRYALFLRHSPPNPP